MRLATVIRIVVVLVVALAVTAVAIVMSTDFSTYKRQIESAVRDATGRQFAIDGAFSLHIGLTPAITAENVRFANAGWGSRPEMAKIDRISAEVRLIPLFFGEVQIKRLVIVGADLVLETDKQGRGNWMFAAEVSKAVAAPPTTAAPAATAAQPQAPVAAGGALSLPSFDRIHIERARLVLRNGRTGSRDEVTVNSLDAQAADAESPVRIALHGLYTGIPLSLDGTLGPLAGLGHQSAPWPVDLIAKAAGGTLQVKGTIREPLLGRGVDLTVAAQGDDLSALSTPLGQSLPAGPYRLAGRVDEKGGSWAVHDLAVALGRSSLAGELTIDTRSARPRLHATLAAPLLDTADLFAGPAGAAGAKKPDPAAATAAKADDGRIFSAAKLPLDELKGIEANIDLTANRIVVGGIPFAAVTTTLRIKDGVLTIEPLKATVAGAPVSVAFRIAQPPGRPSGKSAEKSRSVAGAPSLAVKLDATRIDLAMLLKEMGDPAMATGKIDLSAEVTGSGNSLRALMAGLDGKMAIVMGKGTIADQTLDLLSADVLKAITPWAPRQRDLHVRCMVGRYDIRRGMLTSRATVFDSDRVALSGEGGVNLATEQIGFTVVPHAKDVSLLQLAVPIRIGGTLAAPVAYPDAGRMAAGAVGTVTGLPGTVAGAIGNLLGGSSAGDGNRCLAALDKGITSGGKSNNAVEGLGRAIEGIGKGIGSGLQNLFGK
jgi:uncharacterized protein involved in outer membrane biogenesis